MKAGKNVAWKENGRMFFRCSLARIFLQGSFLTLDILEWPSCRETRP